MSRLIDKDATLKALKDDPVGRMVAEKYNMDGWLEGLQEVPVIPLDWINGYINWLNSISTVMAAADVNAIKSMLTKWKLDNNGPVCGPDYCEIGGTHNE